MMSLAIVLALSISPTLASADLEREARAIDTMLMAPCCYGQQVSVHRSAAADDVRRDVRARLAAGQTRKQILDAYVGQYGKRILAEPPAAGFDLTLYVTPFVLLVASVAFVIVVLRRFTAGHTADAPPPAIAAPGSAGPLESRLDEELRDLD